MVIALDINPIQQDTELQRFAQQIVRAMFDNSPLKELGDRLAQHVVEDSGCLQPS